MSLVPGAVLIELRYPINADGATLTQITMRRPKVRDQLTAQKQPGTDVEQELTLFANLCEQSTATLLDLDMADYRTLQDTYQGFLGLTPPS